ncbi:MAG: DNA gyrase subunit A, partial [Bacilli bacterium]|nr:DNA gyrase subunit A [Bacilli bacterium]
MAKKPEVIVEETFKEKISIEPLENVMGDRYATYAKYVIQDRAIPDVRDGLKPVQRRIIFSMYKSNNLFNKPTKKCAHTVGTVMGTYHPHGDSSIYEALARMSQDWKVRYPLIDFQGNNGSIDGDAPAAYRYTESRLSELSNEMVKNIDKNTVDMQLNFDDTELEPTVLPARFPNLLCNGTEGIAVALATEIPPHNLREVVEAIIYRINHKTATTEDLLNFVKGPDFPGGGIIYESEGLKNIYLTGRGRIEVSAKAEIVKTKDLQQVVITEIPYKTVKIQLVYEIDKIIHSKSVSGLLEVRDESDWKGIRIVIDCKKDAKADLLLKYLMKKTSLLSSYNANMVSIVNGRPRTLSLIEILDAYIAHQVEVITRQSRFDLIKFSDRLHIVTGLITASLSINEVV